VWFFLVLLVCLLWFVVFSVFRVFIVRLGFWAFEYFWFREAVRCLDLSNVDFWCFWCLVFLRFRALSCGL